MKYLLCSNAFFLESKLFTTILRPFKSEWSYIRYVKNITNPWKEKTPVEIVFNKIMVTIYISRKH